MTLSNLAEQRLINLQHRCTVLELERDIYGNALSQIAALYGIQQTDGNLLAWAEAIVEHAQFNYYPDA